MQGIYKITNTINKKFYIGSSVDIIKRWRDHEYRLKNNKHHSSHLQNAYNKYGINAFKFEVLEVVDGDIETLREKEQEYLSSIDWSMSYNMAKDAKGGNSGMTEEVKKAISAKNRSFDEETIEYIRSQLALGRLQKDIAEELNVNKNVLCSWVNQYINPKADKENMVIELRKKGYLQREIKEKTGLSFTFISRVINSIGKKPKLPRGKFSTQELKQLQKWKEEGVSNLEMCRRTSTGHTAIAKWLKWLSENNIDDYEER